MNEYQRQLLDRIAATESPDYNVMYGGGRFDDYSQHPGVYNPIQTGPNAGKKSSAAGRYQFLKGTWDDLANRYGYEDFSPENQDAGAWNLAAERYPGGEEALMADIRNKGVDAVLPALAGTWTSLPGGIEQAGRYSGAEGALTGAQNMTRESGGGMSMANVPLTESEIQRMVAAGLIPQEQAIELLKYKTAKSDSQTKMPEGRSAGKLYVAANPLEHLAAGLRGYRGKKAMDESLERMQENVGKVGEGRLGYGQAIQRQMYPNALRGQPPAPPPVGPAAATPPANIAADPTGMPAGPDPTGMPTGPEAMAMAMPPGMQQGVAASPMQDPQQSFPPPPQAMPPDMMPGESFEDYQIRKMNENTQQFINQGGSSFPQPAPGPYTMPGMTSRGTR
jgi:muramidase (phage lysozyme)